MISIVIIKTILVRLSNYLVVYKNVNWHQNWHMGEKLYIVFLFLILFCELADKDFLVDGTGLVTSLEAKTISEFCLTSWVWPDFTLSNNLVHGKQYGLTSSLSISSSSNKLFAYWLEIGSICPQVSPSNELS